MKESEFIKMCDHILRIDMVDREKLLYRLSAEEVAHLKKRLHSHSDSFIDREVGFWAFQDILDRIVMVRASEVRRFIFLFEAKGSVGQQYFDNFNLLEVEPIDDPDKYIGPDIPSAVFKLRNSHDVYSFYLDPDDSFIGLDDDDLSNPVLRENGFVHLVDADGEDNFIALHNVQLIELAREQVYPDDMWEEMQQMEDEEKEESDEE